MHLLHVGLRLQRGRYELLAPIGQGGTGSVWRALDHREGRSCAIKLLPVPEGVPGARPELGRAAVAREEEVASRLDHPGACRLLGIFEDGGWACVVMELCARSLADRIEDEGPLSDEEALRVCDAVAEALSAAHARGIVHRDVKPQNILLREDGSVALSDWGLAHARSATGTARTTATTMLGTLPYLAPEVRVDPAAASPASDVYALGITLAWACTGRLPGDPYVPEVREGLRAALSERVYERVTRACAWDPSERGWAGKGVGAQARPSATRSAGGGFWGGGPRPPATPPGLGIGRVVWPVLALCGVAAIAFGGAMLGVQRAGDASSCMQSRQSFPNCDKQWRPTTSARTLGPRETVGVGVADIDADGHTDSVFANQLDETLSIYWGDGVARLKSPTTLNVGRVSGGPALGDIDGDGWSDVIVPDADRSELRVFVQDSRRHFIQNPSVYQPDLTPTSQPALLDWDGDAVLDLLVVAEGGIKIRNGTGRGDFRDEQFEISRSGVPSAVVHRASESDAVLLGGPSTILVAAGPEGVARLVSTWPMNASAFLTIGEQMFVRNGETILRLLPDGSACVFASLDNTIDDAIAAFTDLEGDLVPEGIGFLTCTGCTSNHVLLGGVVESRVRP